MCIRDRLIGGVLLLAGLEAHSGLAPRRHRAGTTDRALALAAAVGVVAGVHDGTADGGPPTHVTLAASLTDLNVLVLDVADLADGGHALGTDVTHLAGGEADLSHAVLLGHQLSELAGGADQLAALAGVELDVDRKSTRLNSSHIQKSRMPSSA